MTMTPDLIAALDAFSRTMARELQDAGSEDKTLKDAWETCEKAVYLISDLIEQLAIARATVSAQADEKRHITDDRDQWKIDCEEFKRERDALLDALGPLAAMAERYDPDDGDGHLECWSGLAVPKIMHLRAARAAYDLQPQLKGKTK
jgi:hypothetical protein